MAEAKSFFGVEGSSIALKSLTYGREITDKKLDELPLTNWVCRHSQTAMSPGGAATNTAMRKQMMTGEDQCSQVAANRRSQPENSSSFPTWIEDCDKNRVGP